METKLLLLFKCSKKLICWRNMVLLAENYTSEMMKVQSQANLKTQTWHSGNNLGVQRALCLKQEWLTVDYNIFIWRKIECIRTVPHEVQKSQVKWCYSDHCDFPLPLPTVFILWMDLIVVIASTLIFSKISLCWIDPGWTPAAQQSCSVTPFLIWTGKRKQNKRLLRQDKGRGRSKNHRII